MSNRKGDVGAGKGGVRVGGAAGEEVNGEAQGASREQGSGRRTKAIT